MQSRTLFHSAKMLMNYKHWAQNTCQARNMFYVTLSSAARWNLTAVQFPLQVQHLRNAKMTAHSRYAVKPKMLAIFSLCSTCLYHGTTCIRTGTESPNKRHGSREDLKCMPQNTRTHTNVLMYLLRKRLNVLCDDSMGFGLARLLLKLLKLKTTVCLSVCGQKWCLHLKLLSTRLMIAY